MIGRIFPKAFDNAYRGHRLAIWLLIPVVALRLVIGFNSMVFPHAVATGPDAIPVDLYGHGGGAMVLHLFALLGLWGFLFAIQAVLVLIRYRAMIPLIYLLLLLQQIGGKMIGFAHPIVSQSNSSTHDVSIMVVAVWTLTLVGFSLSLLDGRRAGKAKSG